MIPKNLTHQLVGFLLIKFLQSDNKILINNYESNKC